jgi:hypothetical protein
MKGVIDVREREYRVWDKVEKVMLFTRESWGKTWKDQDNDPNNEYDFHTRELFITQDGHIVESEDGGVCDTHYYLQGKPRYALMDSIGRKAKDGTKIFEDDIVVYDGDEANSDCRYRVRFDDEMLGFTLGEDIPISDTEHLIILGNIWQNPELLEFD